MEEHGTSWFAQVQTINAISDKMDFLSRAKPNYCNKLASEKICSTHLISKLKWNLSKLMQRNDERSLNTQIDKYFVLLQFIVYCSVIVGTVITEWAISPFDGTFDTSHLLKLRAPLSWLQECWTVELCPKRRGGFAKKYLLFRFNWIITFNLWSRVTQQEPAGCSPGLILSANDSLQDEPKSEPLNFWLQKTPQRLLNVCE